MGTSKWWTIDHQRYYAEVLGGHHLIRITPYPDHREPRFAHVDVQLLDGGANRGGLRRRIRNAMMMLRDRHDMTGFMLVTADEAEALMGALRAACSVAFIEEDSSTEPAGPKHC